MIEKYAAIISALSAFISTGVVIWISFFRKTRRERVDELKTEMQVLFTGDAVKRIINDYDPPEEFFKLLKPKFQKKRYKDLHQCAYDELTFEGRNRIVNTHRKIEEGLRNLAIAKENQRHST